MIGTCKVYANPSWPQGRSDTQAFLGVIRPLDLDPLPAEFPINNPPEQVIASTSLVQKGFQYPSIDTPPLTLVNGSLEPSADLCQLVTIATMAPEQLEVFKPFHVTVESYEDEFRADFLDANLSAFGATRNEAIWNLKDIIASTLYTLLDHEDGRLSRGLARQLAVLRSYIRKNK